MALRQIDTTKPYQAIDWLVKDLIPRGMITIVAALPGAGKTTVMANLTWSLSSAELQRTFLDRAITPGASIYVNCDSPTGDGRSVRYLLDQLKLPDPTGRLDQIHIMEPELGTYGLGEAELDELRQLALDSGAVLIVIDSFMACFPNINANRLRDAMGPMTALRELATTTGAAVVIIDHLPKPMSGEKVGARGVMGSVGKSAQARAVHILQAVDPEEAGGRHVIRWHVQKMTFGPVPKPFAVECIHVDGGLLLAVGTVDEALAETRTARATHLLRQALLESGEGWIGRKDLLSLARTESGLGLTASKGALDALLHNLGVDVEQRTLPKPGAPIEYRMAAEPEVPSVETSD